MRFSITPVFVLAGLATTCFANVFVTNPVATTTVHANQPFNLVWQLNSDAPLNLSFASVALYVGSTTVQEIVTQLVPSVQTANVTSLNVTIDPTVGANYDKYFFRFTSLSIPDPTNSQSLAEAFSATFTIDGMTGQFTPAQMSAIQTLNATTNAPGAPGTSSSSTPLSFGSAPTLGAKAQTTASSSSASPTAKPSQPASSALSTGINMALLGAFFVGSAGLLL